MHGKSSTIYRTHHNNIPNDILNGLPNQFQVGRYHSLYGEQSSLRQLKITATTPDGVVMAISHETMPIAAVQFHPESILTLPSIGMKIIGNAIDLLRSDMYS
jgi:anthranilate synthase